MSGSVLEQELQDERILLFEAFSKEDHAVICRALSRHQQDREGAMRLASSSEEYRISFDLDLQRKSFKHANFLWRIAHAAYRQKYGEMP